MGETVRLTMTQALVRCLCAQRTMVDGHEEPLFPGVFAIFGHGNGVPQVSHRQEVREARAAQEKKRREQRVGV